MTPSLFIQSFCNRGALLALAFSLVGGCSRIDHKQSALDPKGLIAQNQYDVFMLSVWITIFLFCAVGGCLLYVLWKYRVKSDEEAKEIPPQSHGNSKVEASLIIASSIILVILAIPTLQGVVLMNKVPDPNDEETLKKLKRGPVRTVSNGHALYIYIYDGKRRHTIRNEIVELFRGPEVGSNIKKILRPKHFAKYHLPTTRTHKNAPDLIIVSKPHVVFGRLGGKKLVSSTKPRGMHGYFPKHPDLWPLFIASGPAVKTSTNPVQMRNIDVAPTLLKTMGLQFPGPIDGQVKTEILKP